jgi:hypothetical protein
VLPCKEYSREIVAMVARSTSIVGRLVRAQWHDAEEGEREDTCVIVDDGPAGVTLFPLATAARRRLPGEAVMTALPLAELAALIIHPWSFLAVKVTRGGHLFLLARGRQYRPVQPGTKPRRVAEPMRAAGRRSRARKRKD